MHPALWISKTGLDAAQTDVTATVLADPDSNPAEPATTAAVGLPGDSEPVATDTPTPREVEPEPDPTADMELEPEEEENAYLAQSGDILFEDDFSNNNNAWPEEYLEDELGFYESFLDDGGKYVVAVGSDTDDGHVVWFTPDMDDVSDFVLSVEAIAETDSESYLYGIVFRSNDEGAYFFEIDFEGFSVTTIDTNDEWTELIEYTFSDAVIPNGVNELQVEAIGPQLTFFINGEQVASIEDDTFTTGTVGVVADVFNINDELEVVFDNLLVTAP